MELNELVEVMKKNGVAGAGGAGFPTYAKLDKRVRYWKNMLMKL